MDLNIKNIFITGTDTGVGKSIFSSILALAFYNQDKKVCISKPIQTGSPRDTDFLGELTGNKIPIFNTYSFSLPAAPVVSAEHENKKIEIEKIISDIKKLEKEFDCVIVEGIGGIAVPIRNSSFVARRSEEQKTIHDSRFTIHYLVADLVKDLNYPLVIVARAALGTINHTVLTIEFAKQKRLNLLGFVISLYDETLDDPVIKTAPDIISRLTQVPCLMKVPKVKELSFKSINSIQTNSLLL
ncbi:MAG: dethiobiotin synthase [Candidatus Melainabacteria bacterium RIFCSPLOWO2_02_FULL_35_15]|nr:MAG: dethiobiotin synthase [Candidatus Melainabacteria bacterium RIFCSPLOWO2_12_FULL_35_11]OGI14681.1 MAG: dethiobiotin synthase [Candidatus Melainabacteria bacterium RIFCSPLOWO2_02_FULL_35_15]